MIKGEIDTLVSLPEMEKHLDVVLISLKPSLNSTLVFLIWRARSGRSRVFFLRVNMTLSATRHDDCRCGCI